MMSANDGLNINSPAIMNENKTFDVAPAPITLRREIFFALTNSSSSGSTNPANSAIKTAKPPVLILIFSSVATIPCAPSCMTSTIGTESKKYAMFALDWIVTPGISTVISENDSGFTKKFDRFETRYQNAAPIIIKPKTTLVLEKILVARWVLLRILESRTQRATRSFSNTSVVLGFIMMGAACW